MRDCLAGQKGKTVAVALSLLSYRVEDPHVIFSPALDMFGYGHTEKEARVSFDETLTEFIRSAGSKQTLPAELGSLG